MTNRILHRATLMALFSNSRFRVGAVVYKGSRILGEGWNDMAKTHTKSPKPYKTICAEFDAILGISRFDLLGSSIYVHRLKRDGSPGTARPCEHCETMLKEAGIKRVEYSVG